MDIVERIAKFLEIQLDGCPCNECALQMAKDLVAELGLTKFGVPGMCWWSTHIWDDEGEG